MAKVVNLNRFRKKKAKEAKELRAEQNRRLHGRTKAERLAEEYEKRRMEKKLDGAFLVPERVDTEQLTVQGAAATLNELEHATRGIISLSELSERCAKRQKGSASRPPAAPEKPTTTDQESGRED